MSLKYSNREYVDSYISLKCCSHVHASATMEEVSYPNKVESLLIVLIYRYGGRYLYDMVCVRTVLDI